MSGGPRETMMSSEMSMLRHDHAHIATIVPHCAVASGSPPLAYEQTVPCPRCGRQVTLPSWVDDGDLTECRGLLLRITRDARGYQLEHL